MNVSVYLRLLAYCSDILESNVRVQTLLRHTSASSKLVNSSFDRLGIDQKVRHTKNENIPK